MKLCILVMMKLVGQILGNILSTSNISWTETVVLRIALVFEREVSAETL